MSAGPGAFRERRREFLGAFEREEVLAHALETTDASGTSLRHKLAAFVTFLTERCQPSERAEYLTAMQRIQPGLRGERPHDDEDVAGANLLPNVRLASGAVRPDVRRRLLLGFNTPFFPEILVASSVLAEGVDLHLNCRHVIHHDLSWNPSTIEQRTGRVDRIGSKAERVKDSIRVYMPFVAATQDEKMYRVVTDRERWFRVLMGDDYQPDEASTDRLAERVPLPDAAASELAMDLRVWTKAGSV
jgi:Helicase conserved C-terminal domain